MEAELTNDFAREATARIELDSLTRKELLALLREVTEQRDQVLSQFEAMALQTDESAREVAEAQLEEHHEAERAKDSERHAEQEAAHAKELSSQLEEERRKSAAIAAEFARFRDAVERAPVEDPWSVLGRAALQIVSDWVAWARAKIPPDSPLLPWFDRAVELAKTAGGLLSTCGKAFFEWAKPHAVALWRWLKSETARRMNKE
ncbi:hypothetical protein ACNHKD_05990 [Methylocystis sp. JAN1]|uniref:hypothetical protein n=1 Tax=Methylocystis sp. JAN1 TaxID=3397211 RepID=UPI003FA33A0D